MWSNKLHISKEGIMSITILGIVAFASIFLFTLINYSIIAIIGSFSFILFIFTIYFFRDPERIPPEMENAILSPADGTIILIDEVYEGVYLKEKGKMVSIFLSLFNVHINRIPISGVIEHLKYEKGNFYPAFLKKSSLINENYSIGIANGKHKIFFRQIAGILARRIINNLKPGEKVIKGKRFGMIKFGSRMDIIMPMSFKITVKLNQKVIGCETIIGVLSQ